jgi:hypothetical protein
MRTEPFRCETKKFIETGSYIGLGIDLALQSGFEEIYSIELTEHYYNSCQEKFKGDDRIHLILGDSYFELEKLLNRFPEEPFTYWLDGHYSGGDTGIGIKESPLLKELEVILARKVPGELIYVDDMRLYRDFDQELNISNIMRTINCGAPYADTWTEPSAFDPKDILVIHT